LGLDLRATGLTFSDISLRAYLHSLGLVLSLGALWEVSPESAPLTGFDLARVLNNLERNRGVRAASRAFHRPKCLLDIFYQLRRLVLSRIVNGKVSSPVTRDLFCVLTPDAGDLPVGPDALPDGQPDRLALFCALQRFTGNRDPSLDLLGNKCFASGSGLTGWTFGAEHGVALFGRPGATIRARRCHHKNISRLMGFFQLYQGYLADRAASPANGAPDVLQHAVDAYDKMAVRYSKQWIRWARARFRLDESVKAVVQAHGLTRLHPPDDHQPLPQATRRAFISYSHSPGDTLFRDELEKHFKIMQGEGLLESWSDTQLLPGEDWDGVINEKLTSANLILLLVSADALVSKYIRETEIRIAMDRYRAGDARVIPIILDDTEWKGQPFAGLQALPSGAKPVSRWRSRKTAAADVAAGIRKVISGAAAVSTG
jgi:hypothetical protein